VFRRSTSHPIESAVDRRPSDAEEFGELSLGVGAEVVQLEQVLGLIRLQLRLVASQPSSDTVPPVVALPISSSPSLVAVSSRVSTARSPRWFACGRAAAGGCCRRTSQRMRCLEGWGALDTTAMSAATMRSGQPEPADGVLAAAGRGDEGGQAVLGGIVDDSADPTDSVALMSSLRQLQTRSTLCCLRSDAGALPISSSAPFPVLGPGGSQASESSQQFAREAAQNPHRLFDEEVRAQTQLPLPESENGVVGSAM
jgi:hypothetical protein